MRLGVSPKDTRGGNRFDNSVIKDDGEVVDADVVDDEQEAAPAIKATRPHRRPTTDDERYVETLSASLNTAQRTAAEAARVVAIAMRTEPNHERIDDWLAVVDVALTDLRTVRREVRRARGE